MTSVVTSKGDAVATVSDASEINIKAESFKKILRSGRGFEQIDD